MKKIKPPRPPKTYGLGRNEEDNQMHIDSDGSDGYEQMGEGQTNINMDEAYGKENYELASYFINLTDYQARCNNMNLPSEFVSKAFAIARPQYIWVKDELGRKSKCNVSKGRKQSEANLGG